MSKYIEEILIDNKKFVDERKFEEFVTTKYPNKKLAILACMDARLTALLPAALNLKNGDVKIIKNAGGLISHPFGEVTRSLIVAIYELGVEDVIVLGHTDCGMRGIDSTEIEELMMERGIEESTLDMIRNCGIELENWIHGFDNEEESVIENVNKIKNHPLIPSDVNVYGYIMDSVTGEMTKVC